VLVVAGGRDLLHPPALMRAVARRYQPHSTYEERAGRGHWLMGEPGWHELAERIAGWIEEKAPAFEEAAAPAP
jgi:pimeloyl-ACP methyl ester carboxylesterase